MMSMAYANDYNRRNWRVENQSCLAQVSVE